MRYFRHLVLTVLLLTVGLFLYVKIHYVANIDTTAPVITIAEEEIMVSVNATDEELLQGITAVDDRDGDVTDSLVVETMGKFLETGKMKVTYAAFDKSGNVASASRIVRYSDYTSPRFAINAPLRMSTSTYQLTSVTSNVTAEDCIDGNLTGFIKYVTGENFYYSTSSEGLIAFQVTNSKGDTAKLEVTCQLMDDKELSKPYPVLDTYLVYTKVGQKLNPSKYLKGVARNTNNIYEFDDRDNNRYDASMVKIKDTGVDYQSAGVYRICYTLFSDENNDEEATEQGHVYLFVVVEE